MRLFEGIESVRIALWMSQLLERKLFQLSIHRQSSIELRSLAGIQPPLPNHRPCQGSGWSHEFNTIDSREPCRSRITPLRSLH
jgi:hypothetical protein